MSSSRQKTFATKTAILYFFIAYVVVNVLATAASVVYAIITNSPPPAEGTSLLKVPQFIATVPYHVLIMLMVWPVFAWMYFKKHPVAGPDRQLRAGFRLAWFWLIAAIITDFICFVLPSFFTLTKNTYSFYPYDFYVNYQPWISLIYLAIFLSPLIYLGFLRLGAKNK